MSGKSPKTVDDYIKNFPEETQATLEKVRKAIMSACPEANETIANFVPTYKFRGSLVSFAAYKNHCSLVVYSPKIFEVLKSELHGYTHEGMSIKFPHQKGISSSLVKKIVKLRIVQNEALRSTPSKADVKKEKATVKKAEANKPKKKSWFKR